MSLVARQREVLPPSLPPRGLAREQAAAYVGVGVTKFDQMVGDGRMPKAKLIDGRKAWDRLRLDKAFEALPDEDGDATANIDDEWSVAV